MPRPQLWRGPRRGPVVQSSKFWGAFPLKGAVVLVLDPADDRLPVDSHTLLHRLQNEQQTGIVLAARRGSDAAHRTTLLNSE